MFNVKAVRNPRVRVPLKISREETIDLFEQIRHEKFTSSWPSHFLFLAGNMTDRSSVGWLACYAENGGSSPDCQRLARDAFNRVLPFTYEEFDAAGFLGLAKSWRKKADPEAWREHCANQKDVVRFEYAAAEDEEQDESVDLDTANAGVVEAHPEKALARVIRGLVCGAFAFFGSLRASYAHGDR
jgi:hypothetical protein